jgi:hypothetical protein
MPAIRRTAARFNRAGPIPAYSIRRAPRRRVCRLKPVGHRFSYRLLIDLDRLDAAAKQSGLISVNRAAGTP